MSCVSGKYATETINRLASDCIACDAGTANPNPGSQLANTCTTCLPGTYSASAASVCVSCETTQNSILGSTTKTDCKCNSGHIGIDGAALCTICAAGKYKDGTNPGVCKSCPANTYNSIPGLSDSTSCIPCPSVSKTNGVGKKGIAECLCDEGTFVATGAGSQLVCHQCGPGTFRDEPDSLECDNCLRDTYQDGFGATSDYDCHPCPDNSNAAIKSGSSQDCFCNKGYSGVAGQTCTECAHGKYSDSQTDNYAVCHPCGDGKITNFAGTTAASGCVTCEPGKFASLNQDKCTDCPANTYCENGIQKQCVHFRSNTHNPDTASNNSNVCLCMPGTYFTNSVCNACLQNSFCTGTGNSIAPCPLNSQSVVSSLDINACKCKPGYDGENGGACNACIAGTYKVLEGNGGCQACGIGRFSKDPAQACRQCPVGKASSIAIADLCTACDKGKYSDQAGANTCNSCEFGKWSDADGATSYNTCQWCGAGKFQKTLGAVSENACLECPIGKTKIWQ